MDLLNSLISTKKREISESGGARWVVRGGSGRRVDSPVQLPASKRVKLEDTGENSDATRQKDEKTKSECVEPENVVLKVAKIPRDEVFQRLRAINEVVTYFGESDFEREERLLRLEVEHVENRDAKKGQRNELQEALVAGDTALEEGRSEDVRRREEERAKDAAAFKSDDNCKEAVVLRFLRCMLDEWERDLDSRPEVTRLSKAGKLAAATFFRSERDIQPLLRKLRHKTLTRDILDDMFLISRSCSKREYVQANDAYLRISIGNAPWPMGVTMVGIHERSGREKIFSSNTGHVLNDEVTRKFLQGVKRIMTWCQNKYPTTPSKMVG